MIYRLKQILFFLSYGVFSLSAQIPSGYYDSASGLIGSSLKTELYNIIKNPNVDSYDNLWLDFEQTDRRSDGTVWDIYSAYTYHFTSDQCGNYVSEGDCFNREHSFPKSWFNDASPMYSDLFHIYPSDGFVNGQRGNYPYGEVGTASYTSSNGCKKGNNIYGSYSGTVFEPADEYKGDLARTYFYMVTCYENLVVSWENNEVGADAMLNGTTFPAFEDWALQMLMDWNDQDPVDQKEIDRNNAIYNIQGNRNPFIDHPEFVCLVWGSNCQSGTSDMYNSQYQMDMVYQDNKINIFGYSDVIYEITIKVFNTQGQILKTFKTKNTQGEWSLQIPFFTQSDKLVFITADNGKEHISKKILMHF